MNLWDQGSEIWELLISKRAKIPKLKLSIVPDEEYYNTGLWVVDFLNSN